MEQSEDTHLSNSVEYSFLSRSQPMSLKHPLLIQEVVALVVKHMDPNFDQLKTLRLVSKVWAEVTQSQWRSSCAVLTLIPDPIVFEKNNYKTGLAISEFVREFQDPQSPAQLAAKPFSKYKLRDMTLDFETCNEPGGRANTIWSAIGPLMQYIHFYKCQFNTPNLPLCYASSLINFLVRLIPNLKELALTDITAVKEERMNSSRVMASHETLRTLTIHGKSSPGESLIELLKWTPNLEMIRAFSWTTVRTYDMTLLGLICKARYDATCVPRPLANLKHVDLINSFVFVKNEYEVNMTFPPLGSEAQLSLETLSVPINGLGEMHRYSTHLNKHLRSFSSTLKVLKCFQAPTRTPFYTFLQNVSMNSLTELYLYGTVVRDFCFLKSTPNLIKLTFDLGCYEKRDMLREIVRRNNIRCEEFYDDLVSEVPQKINGTVLCPLLEYLEIDYEFTAEHFEMIGKWMPNLRTLKTVLNENTVPVVCKIWSELEELACLVRSTIDNNCLIRGKAGDTEPKISDLKLLERFQLDAFCHEAELTDPAVFEGLLKMPALKRVEIFVNSQMSADAELALNRGIQFCKVVRNNRTGCCGLSGGADDYRCDRCAFRQFEIKIDFQGSKYIDLLTEEYREFIRQEMLVSYSSSGSSE